MKNINKKGFTLIELLVVVLIIGILAAVALPQYFKAVEKSRASEALSIIGSIAAAQERYRLSTSDNSYATTFEPFDIAFTDKDGDNVTGSSFNTKNFKIEIKTDSVVATRTGGEGSVDKADYVITRYYRNGTVTCSDGTGTTSTGICRSIGIPPASSGSGSGSGAGA